jgi:hypothetical protein
MEYQNTVPSYIWADVTTAINSALQTMHQSPLDYFRKEQIDVTFAAAQNEKDLYVEASVQEVIGPVWIPAQDNRELHRINDESEFNQFFQRFYGMSESDAVASGVPEASYYMIRSRRSYSENSGKDSSQCLLAIKPTPTSSTIIRLLVSKAPPFYTTDEITNLVGNEETPVPSSYVETIFLPLARWHAMRSHFFFEKDKAAMIESDAMRALQALQITNPDMGTKSSMAEKLQKPQS